jgi:cyclophilin family peptidyl-prolyl cis-trans isomerase
MFELAVTMVLVQSISFQASAAPGPCTVAPALGNPVYVEIETTLGKISLELWPDVAPCTINNFIAYANSGRYDGTFFHRAVDDFVIQGGGYAYDGPEDEFRRIVRDPEVVNEAGASNLRRTISMARVGGQVNSATSEFFINLEDNIFLDTVDEGFTAFGRVAETDMPIVESIGNAPRVEGPYALNSALRDSFTELPVEVAPTDLPDGYGCFDPDELPEVGLSGWSRALVNTAGTALEADPTTGGTYLISSFCDGSGAVGVPSVPCTTSRLTAYWSGAWFLDPTPMSCAAIAESEESLASRRDHLHPQVTSELVEVMTIRVPEPAFGGTLLLATGVLLGLGGRGGPTTRPRGPFGSSALEFRRRRGNLGG